MEYNYSEFHSLVKNLLINFEALKNEIGESNTETNLITSMDLIERSISNYKEYYPRQPNKSLSSVMDILMFSSIIIDSLNENKDLIDRETLDRFSESRIQFNKYINTNPSIMDSMLKAEKESELDLYYKSLIDNIKRAEEELGDIRAKFKSSVTDIKDDVSSLETKILNLSKDLKIQVKNNHEISENFIKTLNEKQKEIDDLVGLASGKVIAGDFQASALAEKNAANLLRFGSLIIMFIIIILIGYSLYETTSDNFSAYKAVLRSVFAVILSVPAAYMARESAKHREQQYIYSQTSLELKVITPYISSLPDGIQHQIKHDVANRIFATRDFSKNQTDLYPLNVHELLVELIRKIEVPKNGK